MSREPAAPPVTVVCAADDRYAMPLAVALRSAQDALAAGRGLRIFVLDGGIRDASRARLRRSLDAASLGFLAPDAGLLRGAKVRPGRISIATYYRLLAPLLLPPGIDRAVYLDADVVVRSDLARLFDTDLAGRPVAAVRDPVAPTVAAPCGLADHARLGLPPDLPYFNAGVLLLDLAQWRREAIAEQAIAYVRERGESLRWWDQDALNAVLAGRIQALDPRWNHFPHRPLAPGARQPIALADAWVVHFAARAKPWDWEFRHPSRDLFFHALDRTDWAGWRPRKALRHTAAGRAGARVRASLRFHLARARASLRLGLARLRDTARESGAGR